MQISIFFSFLLFFSWQHGMLLFQQSKHFGLSPIRRKILCPDLSKHLSRSLTFTQTGMCLKLSTKLTDMMDQFRMISTTQV